MESEYKESLLRIKYISFKQDVVLSLLAVKPSRRVILEGINHMLDKYDAEYRILSSENVQKRIDELRDAVSKSILNDADKKYDGDEYLQDAFRLLGLIDRLLFFISCLGDGPICMRSCETLYYAYVDVKNFINDRMNK